MKQAPIHREARSLCGVLLKDLGNTGSQALLRRLASLSIGLLEDLTLAVEGIDRERHLRDADAELRLLRLHLGLAHDLNLLDGDSFLDLTEQADLVGRQLGGWLKSLSRRS